MGRADLAGMLLEVQEVFFCRRGEEEFPSVPKGVQSKILNNSDGMYTSNFDEMKTNEMPPSVAICGLYSHQNPSLTSQVIQILLFDTFGNSQKFWLVSAAEEYLWYLLVAFLHISKTIQRAVRVGQLQHDAV